MAEEPLNKLKAIQGKIKLNIKTLQRQIEFWQELDDFLADQKILLENIKPFFNLIGNTQPLVYETKEVE